MIKLIFAGCGPFDPPSRMIVNRRELPQSRIVGRPRFAPRRHIAQARILRTVAPPTGPHRCRIVKLDAQEAASALAARAMAHAKPASSRAVATTAT